MALSQIDRDLLDRCLHRKSRAWESFVDRFLGLVIHVISHSADSRNIKLTNEDREDLASEVFCAIVRDDMAVLRRFRGKCSLATYLTVVSRRVVVRELAKRQNVAIVNGANGNPVEEASSEQRIDSREEVERLLTQLSGKEADIVRMYHLEGKTYAEISSHVGLAENSIGPTLTRARDKMRHGRVESVG